MAVIRRQYTRLLFDGHPVYLTTDLLPQNTTVNESVLWHIKLGTFSNNLISFFAWKTCTAFLSTLFQSQSVFFLFGSNVQGAASIIVFFFDKLGSPRLSGKWQRVDRNGFTNAGAEFSSFFSAYARVSHCFPRTRQIFKSPTRGQVDDLVDLVPNFVWTWCTR